MSGGLLRCGLLSGGLLGGGLLGGGLLGGGLMSGGWNVGGHGFSPEWWWLVVMIGSPIIPPGCDILFGVHQFSIQMC